MAAAFSQLVKGELRHPETGETIKRLAISGPPRHGKTTVIDEHGIPWILGQYPWWTMMFFTSSDPLADQYDSSIATTLRDNKRHRVTFPEAVPWEKKGWSSMRGRYLTASNGKDPSFKAYGIGARVLGSGANGIVMDDPVDPRTARSEAELGAVKSDYDTTISNRLNPGGFQLFVGHRWGPTDFLQHLIDQWDFTWLNIPALGDA